MAGILVRVGYSNGRYTVSFPGRVVECGPRMVASAVRDAVEAWRRVYGNGGGRRTVNRSSRRR